MTADPASSVIKTRSFTHNGRTYDIQVATDAVSHRRMRVEATCNGHPVIYEYPDGGRVRRHHTIDLTADERATRCMEMNAVDFAMDGMEEEVRRWVA